MPERIQILNYTPEKPVNHLSLGPQSVKKFLKYQISSSFSLLQILHKKEKSIFRKNKSDSLKAIELDIVIYMSMYCIISRHEI